MLNGNSSILFRVKKKDTFVRRISYSNSFETKTNFFIWLNRVHLILQILSYAVLIRALGIKYFLKIDKRFGFIN
jgi:hypothetical protein